MRKINYPKNRKSPIRHRVREHKRLGRPVHSYMRGEGDKSTISKRKKLAPYNLRDKTSSSKFESTSFNVRVEYPDFSVEALNVIASNFVRALDQGLEERRRLKIPISVALRKRGG